jgi:hypothetical protein
MKTIELYSEEEQQLFLQACKDTEETPHEVSFTSHTILVKTCAKLADRYVRLWLIHTIHLN